MKLSTGSREPSSPTSRKRPSLLSDGGPVAPGLRAPPAPPVLMGKVRDVLKRVTGSEIEVGEAAQLGAFDYASLSPELASAARQTAERIRRRRRAAIIETGRDLIAMRKSLPDGQFIPWVNAEFDMTERSA